MGVDIKDIRTVIHITPPYTIQAYFQETGRAGRDGQPATAVLHYNNRDIGKNKKGMQEAVRTFCQSKSQCLRRLLLTSLDTDQKYINSIHSKHVCCGVCQLTCDCPSCV